MSRISLYRSLIVATAVAAGLALPACNYMAKNHETAVSKGTISWNMARLAIIYQLAETQYKVGDFDKCTETLKEAFATKAPFAPMHVLAAKVDIERGNLEQAVGNLNAAI